MSTETDARIFRPPATYNEEERDFQTQSVPVIREYQTTSSFRERHTLQLDKFEYERTGNEPGLVLIFNQETFPTKKKRLGTRRDVNEIIICMQRLGYNVHKENVMTDLTTNEIIQKLKLVSEMDLADANCTFTFFLTHGDDESFLETKDGSIFVNTILSYFGRNRTLDGKPKIFIIQACKGERSSTVGDQNQPYYLESSSPLVPTQTFQHQTEIYPDMLVVFSALQDHAAFRNRFQGTWFIQELRKVFSSYGRRDDILSLIMRICKCVAGNYYQLENSRIKKQMPVFISTLTKKFYLNRNKDRDFLLRIDRDLETMQEDIREIKDNLKRLLKI